MNHLIPGQRFVSQSEPELGLGLMLAASEGRITLLFRAAGETRLYALRNAPLRRFLLKEGDKARDADGRDFVVRTVRTEAGLAHYGDGAREIPETLLSDRLAEKSPARRLLHGDVDESEVFALRHRALLAQSDLRRSPLRGFLGARVDLIPHQLHIAREVSSRLTPRVLLADEVGLGKTIEACLIMHRLMLTGQVARVLILTPDSLVHQWFVELYRKFNLWAAIYDSSRCEAMLQSAPEENPFDDAPLVLSPLSLFRGAPVYRELAKQSQWDLVMVDEAHHLGWDVDGASPEYQFVEDLSTACRGLILLTATPEQLGEEGHHARLRLLDPARFPDFSTFKSQTTRMRKVANFAEKIVHRLPFTAPELASLGKLSKLGVGILEKTLSGDNDTEGERNGILSDLLDRHGPSRVMFRNSRSAIPGFPARERGLILLRGDNPGAMVDEFQSDLDPTLSKPIYDYDQDARLKWLVGLLRDLAGTKVLLISRYREKVEALEMALRSRINLKVAQFHEGLTLIQRDRNAAWFSEPDGADLLLCSEIGSEGRNFQFANHLVLWDLPLDPEAVEQRIGRLDRIGQSKTIQIHIPIVRGSPQAVVAEWLDKGLDVFRKNYRLGAGIHETFAHEVVETALMTEGASGSRAARTRRLVASTKRAARALEKRLMNGRDRLLEMSSCRTEAAREMIAEISSLEKLPRLVSFLAEMFEHLGLRFEDLGDNRLRMGGGDLIKDRLPGLPENGMTATSCRELAKKREDLTFLTWDHPIVTAVIDSLLTSTQGSAAFAVWPGAPVDGVLIEAIHIIEPQVPPRLHLDRFLPPTPIRVVVDSSGRDLGEKCLAAEFWSRVESVDALRVAPHLDAITAKLDRLLAACEQISGARMETIVEESLAAARRFYGGEILRLQRLAELNPLVGPEDVGLLQSRLEETLAALRQPTLRLDAVRMIVARSSGHS